MKGLSLIPTLNIIWSVYTFNKLLWVFFVVVLILLWTKFKRNGKPNSERFLKSIPGPSGLWFCFMLLKYFLRGSLNTDLQQLLSGLSYVFKKCGMYRVWIGHIPVVVLYKPETIEPLLSKDDFLERPPEYQFGCPLIGCGLITSSAEKWRKRRRLLNPAFHHQIVKDSIPIFNKQSKILIEKLKAIGPDEAINIVPYIQNCTLDIICETAMGINTGIQQGRNVEYLNALHTVLKILPERVMQPWLHPDFIFYSLPMGRTFKRNLKIVRNFTKKIISARKEDMLRNPPIDLDRIDEDTSSPKKRLAFLDLLLYHHLYEKELTEDDIQGEVDTLMFAGHDTSAIALQWALFMVGNYPEIQENIHRELDAIFQGDKTRSITMDDLREMKYLKCVCNETLRLYPAGSIIGRLPTKDANINGYTIPTETRCLISLYQVHRDPKYFPDPEVFKPERFFSNNINDIHRYAYIPFSAGPRNCIGIKYAQYEELTLLADILRNFSIKSKNSRDKVKLSIEVVLRPVTPFQLYLTSR